MPNAKMSAFTLDATPDDTDWVAFVDKDGGGAGVHQNKILTFNDLSAYLESRLRRHNASIANQVTGAVDVYVTDSNIVIPDGRLQAKTKVRWELKITKGAAGTGTPTFNIRIGSGVLADASRCLFTWPAANTAVADEMKVEIMATFRSVGSGTNAVIEGGLMAQHRLTTTGFGGTGQGANIFVNTLGGGFDSTPTNQSIGLSVNPGTGGAWTIRQVHAVLENLA